ncbi:putative 2-aminoethylphosphonate ABC transporter permease subunit [Fusobacterium ulcerans]|jgi:iron(III) transport system permease protein|uniref:Putrescine transport system permease protein PotH n=1 Tax=Fusobacterium ulcerans TaxID=861 RepID=A0AAX2JDQ9_9FUSO|nr:putative 2-aminoethylphosphonate ABC transporter permease subunit [Fusobacterium ulcerans]AVQ26630.1 putative 2-aminoethylphosphonate ABC transporter permease subunit [Fusobacterium ulcerans]EFS25249.1 putative 2-aminoethylphosphonate ABC transporter, permease [Fusobacterium ulcerans ATCC 49185]SQJ06326.1 Putrescine transport system permease protein PotH [Fusobacterium ulcerans]
MEKTKDEVIREILTWFILIFLIVAIVFPLGLLLTKSFENNSGEFIGLSNFKEYFSNKNLLISLKNTFTISIASSVISLVLAFIYAYGVQRTTIRFKNIFKYIALMPLFAPTMMHGISLVYLFGRKGAVTTGFFDKLPQLAFDINLYGATGIIIAEVLYIFPQIFLVLNIALSTTDYRLYEAADMLGTSNFRKFFTITLPNMKYGMISSFIIAFILSFTDFGAPKVVGGNFSVLATDVYIKVVGQNNMSMGAVVSIILLIPSVAAFFIDQKIQKKQGVVLNAKSIPYTAKENKARDIFFYIYTILICLFIISIFVTIFVSAFSKLWPYDLSFSFNNFKFYDYNGGIEIFFKNSFILAVLSGIFGTFMTFMSAYLIEKKEKKTIKDKVIYFLSLVPLALPGMVIGISYIFFFNKSYFTIPFLNISIMNPFNSLYKTIWIMVLANVIHFYSISFLTANTALKKLDKEFERVSLSMGIPWYKTFSNVTFPMCLESILEIFFYYFVNSMVTISALVFLYTSSLNLLSIAVINLDDTGEIAKASAMSIVILLTNIIIKIIYQIILKFLQKRKNKMKEENV